MQQHKGLISAQQDRASMPVPEQQVAMQEDTGSMPGSMQQDSLYDYKARRLRVGSHQSSVTDTLEKKLYKIQEKATSRKPSGRWTADKPMPVTPGGSMQDKYRVAAQWDNTAMLQAEARADYHRNPTGSLTTTRTMPAIASKQGRFVVTTHRESATLNPSMEDTAKGTTQKSSQTPGQSRIPTEG